MLGEDVSTPPALTKEQAEKIAQITSSVYPQGSTWVLQEWDLETGAMRLTRGLTQGAAKRRLKHWRRERIELLLRSNPTGKAYTIRVWQENPTWDGQGIWEWIHPSWYTTEEEATKVMEQKAATTDKKFQIYEMELSELPGHFLVSEFSQQQQPTI